MIQIHDRESIENLKGYERPSVRIRVEVCYVDQDGNKEHGLQDKTGKIDPDGNSVWVSAQLGGRSLAIKISWGLLLEVLNDKHAPPIWINQDDPVELEVQ